PASSLAWSRSDNESGSAGLRQWRRHRGSKARNSRVAAASSWRPRAGSCRFPAFLSRPSLPRSQPCRCLSAALDDPMALAPFGLARNDRGRALGPAARQRDQHRDLQAVAAILLAEQGDEVALLELDADQDVAGGRDRKQKMARRHGWRRP